MIETIFLSCKREHLTVAGCCVVIGLVPRTLLIDLQLIYLIEWPLSKLEAVSFTSFTYFRRGIFYNQDEEQR